MSAVFPNLKTNAVAQYPAKRGLRFQNERLRFVDGTEQRYRDSAGPLHRWEIMLEDLDEGEMTAIEGFFLANQGQFAEFAFRDPWDGQSYAHCRLESDEMDLTSSGEMRVGTRVVVVEGR